MLCLLILIIPFIIAENEFYHLSWRTAKPMEEIRQMVVKIWKMDSVNEFQQVFYDHFKYTECDLRTHDKKVFYERYIKNNEIPVVIDAYEKWMLCEMTECHEARKHTYYRFFNVKLRNGFEIGFKVRYIEERRPWYFLEEAIVYNCFPNKPILGTFINYKPVFKTQKFMNEVWKQHLTSLRLYHLPKYIDDKFIFFGCPRTEFPDYSKCDKNVFHQFYMRARSAKPEVYDAIEIKEGQKWQFAVTWDDRNIQFQIEDVSDVLVLTKGREINCRT